MLKTLGVVQVCSGLPALRANAARRLGGRPLLEWVVRRVTDSTRLDGVIVVACGEAECRELCRCVPSDVPVHLCDAPDMLSCFAEVCAEYPAEAVVRVQGDDLFIDPALIDRLVTTAETLPGCDYATFALRDGRPAILSPVDVYAEWFRSHALRRAHRAAKSLLDRQEVTRYLYRHPKRFHLHFVPAPDPIDRDDVRLTLANDEDWDLALAIYDALGPESLDWQRIAGFLHHHPAMRQRMAAMNRATA